MSRLQPPTLPYDTVLRLQRAHEFIEAHAAQPLDLRAIATHAFLSPHHFHRLYKALFGETPHATLTQARLRKAQLLLTQSSLPIRTICWEVGYESLGSFCTLFHRHTGCTPTQWRHQAQAPRSIYISAPHLFIPACFRFRYPFSHIQLPPKNARFENAQRLRTT